MIQEINGVDYTISEKLDNFTIHSRPSSNVAFFGISHDAGNIEMFIQFKNGSSYFYSGLTEETLVDLSNCDSIGSFVSRNIVGKFKGVKDATLILPAAVGGTEISEVYIDEAGDLKEPTF